MHTLITGSTESGKTTIAKKLANQHIKSMPVIVLTPIWENWGEGIEVYDDEDEFLARFWGLDEQKSVAIVDEGKNTAARFNTAMELTATQGRHWGWSNYYIGQGATMISPDIRGQCSQLMAFAQGTKDSDTLVQEFRAPELENCPDLSQGEFYLVRRFGKDGKRYCKKLNAFSM
ncbi:MAG TPA: hypothetical protein VLK33_19805 [Terriglobales bacterium]|nr:hypothetical protein [Terriglobales bacterium]